MSTFSANQGGAVGPPAQPLTILLAEDDATMRSMLAIVLRREGHRVLECRHGGELAAQLAQYYRDGVSDPADLLVVADLRMPETDTLTIMRGLHARGRRPPFVLLTAFGSPEVHAAAADLGVITVLDKPFDFEELRTVVRVFSHNRAPS